MGGNGTRKNPELTNAKQKKTRERVRKKANDINWDDIESLVTHLKCELKPRGGSMVTIKKNEDKIVVHKPHGPSKQTHERTVKRIDKFLKRNGC